MNLKRPYKLAINTRLLLNNSLEGIGWFEYHILKNWVSNYPQHTFYFIFDRPYHPKFIFGDNVIPIVLYPPARHPILWYIWYEWRLPSILRKIQADIFVSLDSYTSLRADIKKITGIHDVAFALYDGQMDKLSEMFMRHFTPKYIHASNLIVTVSNSTKSDLKRLYDCPESKICVAHNAPSDVYKPMDVEKIRRFKEQNTDGNDFFLFVGSIHPRKNVLRLLQSFEYFKTKYKTGHKLVLIGRMAWQYEKEEEFLRQMVYKLDVILIPHSIPEIIAQWMGSASALMLISKYEGFGVPLVEAMACQTPIICSNVSSLPEVSGDAALCVDSESIEEVVDAMHQVTTNLALRTQLVQNGITQVKKYNWESAADILWKEVERLLD